uniref:NADH-ubiquinone oxidoreductase chain 5 n=1 Tax=Trilophidia annulata TaxID=215063 RepID=A0A0F7J4J4_9ORTH|nr:NADH dehydrogenase subunit 5 [Trilophidia annulata]AKH04346.1 NADH dehydrogenase subunit 5 [Trilophidia annulata]
MCSLSFFILFFMSTIFLMIGVYYLMFDYSVFVEWELFSLNGSMVIMTFIFDWMSLIFMSFVMYISSLVIYYSNDYMYGEKNINRFIMIVLMFIFSMGLLIISPNLISILLGWDGLGLVSYCLVIYYQNVKSYNAGMLTALSNRIGDVAILISISWMLNFGSWNYIYYYDFICDSFEMKFITMLIILASMTKSAQIPFSSWLPAAMAAPTPVSALVHSSTLVTAGVYLLIRFSPMLMTYGFGSFLLLIGCMTMFMAGFGANFEFDLKKIIALSTLSQLGLMMSILSMGYSNLAFFHLLTHALFKALLFMCAGSMIHNLKDCQDIRYMGSIMNFTWCTLFGMLLYAYLTTVSFCWRCYSARCSSLEMHLWSCISKRILNMYTISKSMSALYFTDRSMDYSLGDMNKPDSNESMNYKSKYAVNEANSWFDPSVLSGNWGYYVSLHILWSTVCQCPLKLITLYVGMYDMKMGYWVLGLIRACGTNSVLSLSLMTYFYFMYTHLHAYSVISWTLSKFYYYSNTSLSSIHNMPSVLHEMCKRLVYAFIHSQSHYVTPLTLYLQSSVSWTRFSLLSSLM